MANNISKQPSRLCLGVILHAFGVQAGCYYTIPYSTTPCYIMLYYIQNYWAPYQKPTGQPEDSWRPTLRPRTKPPANAAVGASGEAEYNSSRGLCMYICVYIYCNLLRPPIKIVLLMVPFGYIIIKEKRIPKEMTLHIYIYMYRSTRQRTPIKGLLVWS